MDQEPKTRQGNGRFAVGNPGGPGRPPGHAGDELRRAVEQAITPAHLEAVLRRVLRSALEGNLTAARVVLERTCGRPSAAPPLAAAVGIDLPPLITTADCSSAIDQIAAGVCNGSVDREAAKTLLDLVNAKLKSIEVSELGARISELERASGVVDLGRPSRRTVD